MSDELSAYAYLWDGSEPGWVLWQLPSHDDAGRRPAIFNQVDRTALLVEDEDLSARLISEMRKHNVKTITEYPSR